MNPPAARVIGPYDTPDYPALGIASFAAVLQNESIHVACIDAKCERLDFAAFGIMVPYPGTKIRDLAIQGKGGYASVSSDWEDYRKNAGHPMEMAESSARELVKLQMKAYFVFYLFNWRFYDLMRLFFQDWKIVFRIMGRWLRRRKDGPL